MIDHMIRYHIGQLLLANHPHKPHAWSYRYVLLCSIVPLLYEQTIAPSMRHHATYQPIAKLIMQLAEL